MIKASDNKQFKYDLAIRNGLVLTLDKDWTEFQKGLILIRGNHLAYVGNENDHPGYFASRLIDADGGIVMPAFFNGHTHSAMSMFRGMGNDLPLESWLNDHIWPSEARFVTPENVYLGSMVSAIEMIRCGTGIFVDMYFFQEDTVRACEELGIRVVVGEGILDTPTPNKKTPSDGLLYTKHLYNIYKDHPLVNMSIPAHAPYTCSPDVLKAIGDLSRELNIPATIHLAETTSEDIEMKKKYGKSSSRHLADLGFFQGRSVAYHCNHLSKEDIHLLNEFNVGVVTNPNSNMKLGAGVCPVPELYNSGLIIGIGTDGAASNNNQCMILDMQLSARLHKMTHHDPTVITARQAIRMATLNNAIIYGLDDSIGTLETGKLADLMIINTDQAHWQPLYDPYSQIVYSMQPGDVSGTMVNGKMIMENQKILTVDEDYFINKIAQLGKMIHERG